ncbi:histidine--tRNA ligase [bacterium]|nr:histidine--tRNA ligase [bacterium]|tara:strand:- start:1299 stop:2555 length:1257 start_codon:yes stop_codon:yes gene_type:complete
MTEKLSTQPYKGVRDFYPAEMAIQQYIFSTWAHTAESFGFARYDASVLEPAELYRAKGAENEEMVNQQTYTFTDRGEREVTLRPEMTPTVARMIAAKSKELAWPVRWYSIPNLYRYERAQRGRLREHWQLNCDIFGIDDMATDVEIIALAYQIFMNFGATDDMFTIHINDRQLMHRLYVALNLNEEQILSLTRLNDRRDKMTAEAYRLELDGITGDGTVSEEVIMLLDKSDAQTDVVVGLAELGITNVVFDKSLARGFDYYTGTIFEFKDTDPDNNRSLLGGGRYDNLTALFGGEAVPGVGFGFGDVTMRDFLETHDLLPEPIISPTVVVAPTEPVHNLSAQKIAQALRSSGVSVAVDSSARKIGKKLSLAGENLSTYVVALGEDEIASRRYTLKNLVDGTETTDTLENLIDYLTDKY